MQALTLTLHHTLTYTLPKVPSGAHHIDLMFSDAADPLDVSAARTKELEIIHGWIEARRTAPMKR